MGHDDRREIFERLRALERLVRSRHEEHGGCDDERHRGHDCGHRDHHGHDCCHHHGGEDFQEKRIIDTIVRLVSEQVGRMIEEQQTTSRRHDNGDDEKRIVDLIVGLVSEHVQEIVSTELDRRLGRPKSGETEERSPRRREKPEAEER